MKKFQIQVNQQELEFLQNLLPKGYCLRKQIKKPKKDSRSLTKKSERNLDSNTGDSSQVPINDSSSSFEKEKQRKSKAIPKKEQKQGAKNKSEPKRKIIKNQEDKRKKDNYDLFDKVLEQIEKKKSAQIFIEPVDPIKLQIPHYLDIIKQPMDIVKIRSKVQENKYRSFDQIQGDFAKIVSNCITFNRGNQYLIEIAKKFQKQYIKVLNKHKTKIQSFFSALNSYDKSQHTESNSEEQSDPQKISDKKDKNKIFFEKENKVSKSKKKENKMTLKERNENQSLKKSQIQDQKAEPNQKTAYQENLKKIQEENQQYQQPHSNKKDENTQKIQNEDSNHKVTVKKSKKVKKYSYSERLKILGRIRNLDKATMIELFKAINFCKGDSLDFKVLEDEKIAEIEKKLIEFEIIHQKKQQEAREKSMQKNSKKLGDFQIAEDRDYDD